MSKFFGGYEMTEIGYRVGRKFKNKEKKRMDNRSKQAILILCTLAIKKQ